MELFGPLLYNCNQLRWFFEPRHRHRKVCRKIGEKMRLSPSEQGEHVLIAIYARLSAGGASSSDPTTDDSGDGGDLGDLAAGPAVVSNGGDGAAGFNKGSGVDGGIAEKRERRRESSNSSRMGR